MPILLLIFFGRTTARRFAQLFTEWLPKETFLAVSVLSLEANKGKLAFFGGIDKAKFRRQVRPGDRLKLEVEIIKCKGPMGVGHAVATVDGDKAAEAEIKFIIGE